MMAPVGQSGHQWAQVPEGDPGQPDSPMEARVQGLEKAVSSLQVGAAEQKTLSQQLLEQGKQTQEMVRVMAASKAAPEPSLGTPTDFALQK